ncbi:MAG TPA: heparan-alpha-glucosaminide N-acetyltransferase domain-containing protein [Steroidobacter sp.]|uniref:heparan-alpha-glucosaminide N-acetyltransferase domain-containing protein n=1 Tax=Steroidobacter sp. TaxID=1978227 RepID=UPI002EDBAC53
MTRPLSDAALAQTDAVLPVATARQSYVDLFRGLLIAHMALDHASLMFNAGRGGEELASAAPAVGDFFQFITRFSGVPVAPGFFFMAGFMVALTSSARQERGVSHADVTRRLIIRGLVLIAVDATIMGLPRALMGFYSFMVLTCIGVGIILLALIRDLPAKVLVPAALAVLLLHPLLDVSSLPTALRAMLYEPVRTGAFRSLYPIVPWTAIVVLGFVIGRDSITRAGVPRFWSMLALVSFGLFLVVRLAGGYGNAYEYSSVLSLDFWMFAKYPPDLAFLSWSFACVFASLALLRIATRSGVPRWLQPLVVFGRVPFFFYIVHFYVLGIAAAVLGARYGLLETYLIWLLLLAMMVWPCRWYYRKKLERPGSWLCYI